MNNSLRSVLFVHHATTFYGASRSLLNLIEGLRHYGVSSHVLLPDHGSLTKAFDRANIPYHIVPIEWWLHDPKAGRMGILAPMLNRTLAVPRMIKNISSINEIARMRADWECQIVYSNSFVIPAGIMLARLLHLPHVWHLREFGMPDYGLACDWGFNLTRKLVNKANHLISISEAVDDYLVLPQSKQKSSIIYNGIAYKKDFNRYRKINQNYDDARSQKVFSIVGMLHPAKGQLEAIKAVNILVRTIPDVKLFVVGSGVEEYVNLCKKTVSECGIGKNVVFLGYLDNPYPIYRESDAVLVCSRNEAMGRVTAEAMATETPVIGYASGGTLELVKDNENGLLYKNGPEDLANCMAQIINNHKWTKSLGEQAWVFAKENFTIERYAQQVHNVLLKLI